MSATDTFPTETYCVSDARIVLGIVGPDLEMPHKSVIAYTITPDHGNGRCHLRSDLSVLTQDTPAETLRTAYGALLGFMSACADGYRHEMTNGPGSSENAGLFPADLAEWCYLNSEEIDYALLEIEGDDD